MSPSQFGTNPVAGCTPASTGVQLLGFRDVFFTTEKTAENFQDLLYTKEASIILHINFLGQT